MTDLPLNILVVDDEPAIQHFLRASLSAYGHSIAEMVCGEDALRAVAISHYDLVILDLGLPDIDGLEVTRRLREWTQDPSLFCQCGNMRTTKSPPWMPARMII